MKKPKIDIEELKLSDLSGIGPVYITKLENAGIYSVMDLVIRGPIEIAERTGMEKTTAEKIVNTARKKLTEKGKISKSFESGLDVYKRRLAVDKIRTGTECFDKLFGGGLETKALTEVYGEFGSGKTQFCHTLCVMVQKPKEEGGLNGKAMYIDSENTFRPERIAKIAEINSMNPEKTLDNIIEARAYNTSHQFLLVEESGKFIEKDNIRLIVVDSGTGLFRAEYLGRGTLSERQQRLNKFFHTLVRMAETYNIAVLVTNQVMANPGILFGDPTRPIGGNVVGHTSTYRLYFRKSGKKRIARMVDSPNHPEEEIVFMLGEEGICDPKDEKK